MSEPYLLNRDRIVCKVSHTNGRPILFLPDRDRNPGMPEGWQTVLVGEDLHEANFVKIAVNVIRRQGEPDNVLPDLLRELFGADAGLPGTAHKVAFDYAGSVLRLSPLRVEENAAGELQTWQRYAREQIPPLFGLEFKPGAWNQGYIAQGNDTFLLVTLNKSSMSHDYEDRFLSPMEFRWQSQKRTTQDSRTGERLSQHQDRGVRIHLFVRQEKMAGNKAAPFTYCGLVDFERWEGNQPITVWWRLREPVPESLHRALRIPDGEEV